MKIIIDHQGCKREINGNFQICLSREDAQDMIRCLEQMQTFGWVDVFNRPKSTTNQAPIGWRDQCEKPTP